MDEAGKGFVAVGLSSLSADATDAAATVYSIATAAVSAVTTFASTLAAAIHARAAIVSSSYFYAAITITTTTITCPSFKHTWRLLLQDDGFCQRPSSYAPRAWRPSQHLGRQFRTLHSRDATAADR